MRIAAYLNVHGIKTPGAKSLLPDLRIVHIERHVSIAAYYNVYGIKTTRWTKEEEKEWADDFKLIIAAWYQEAIRAKKAYDDWLLNGLGIKNNNSIIQ